MRTQATKPVCTGGRGGKGELSSVHFLMLGVLLKNFRGIGL